jgi:hypothetical protein
MNMKKRNSAAENNFASSIESKVKTIFQYIELANENPFCGGAAKMGQKKEAGHFCPTSNYNQTP